MGCHALLHGNLPDPGIKLSCVSCFAGRFFTLGHLGSPYIIQILPNNHSAVCAWQLCGGANDDLLQEGLCHTLCVSGLLQPEPLSPQQATADACLHRRHLSTHRQVWVSLCGVSVSWCGQGLFEPSEHIWWVRGLILNAISPPYYLAEISPLPLDVESLFLVGSNIL